MSISLALIPSTLPVSRARAQNALIVVAGVVALALLAQVAVPLPFTPVPITGQTFGVTLLALLYGRRLGSLTVASYLAVGAAGLPVFAPTLALGGAPFGPTTGYLVGMLASAYVVGGRADRGATSGWGRCLGASLAGSLLVYGFGVAGLACFVPRGALLTAGVWPFLPGDVLKTLLAASLAWGLDRGVRAREA